MPEFFFDFPLPAGLHARPASALAELAGGFAAQITLTNQRNEASANAKSALSLIGTAVRQRDRCSLRISGEDEAAALAALHRFVELELPHSDDALPAPGCGKAGASVKLPRVLQKAGVRYCCGTPTSRGIGRGVAIMLEGLALPAELAPAGQLDAAEEQRKVCQAIEAVRAEIEATLATSAGTVESGILKAHLSIVKDISLREKLVELTAQGKSAGQAIVEAGQFFMGRLRSSESAYVRERALDMQDICLHLLEMIYGQNFKPAAAELAGPSVVFAENLGPRGLLSLAREHLAGLVLREEGTTSHTVILARSFGIPTLTAVADADCVSAIGREVVVDAHLGILVTEIAPAVERYYRQEREKLSRRDGRRAKYISAPAATADGRRIEVAANISSAEEVAVAVEHGAEGVGVFRTEILFIGRDAAPTEDEQFEVYAQAARAAGGPGGRSIIIRTIDVGGDKPLPYLNLPHEANPYLGYRGARIYAEHEAIVTSQLRAIARASGLGATGELGATGGLPASASAENWNTGSKLPVAPAPGGVRVMAPMVSSLEEVLWLKEKIKAIQTDLRSQGIAHDPAMPIGIMVEVPAVAFIIDQLCPEVDFFSIGSNDLAQYFMAADRGNATVAALHHPRQPAFLRLLKKIVEDVHRGGRWVGLCGEMAGDVRNLPLLLGMGLDEISMSAPAIPAVKEAMAHLSAAECEKVLADAMAAKNVAEVDRMLTAFCRQRGSQLIDAELMLLDCEAEGKEEAIKALVDELFVAGRADDPVALEEAVWAREALYSTGLGHGFAIPHCKSDAVSANSACVARLKRPIEWGSLDGQPVHTVILLAIRASDTDDSHMKILAKLARKLMHEEFREGVAKAGDAGGLARYLVGELMGG